MSIIALLTDFGTRDWYVASMKGVIADIAPHATIIDISHDIPMGDTAAAAFTLLISHPTYPRGTIFVAVVDPGVGSDRRGLIGCANGYVFVGPDNGVLAPCLDADSRVEVRCLANPSYQRPQVSPTFHGRDIFAPAAANMARGGTLSAFGPAVTSWAPSPVPRPSVEGAVLHGAVAYVDRFGNAITNVPLALARQRAGTELEVEAGGLKLPLLSFYQQVHSGEPVALEGSCGYIEVSINGGSAAEKLGLAVGTPVVVRGRRPSHATAPRRE